VVLFLFLSHLGLGIVFTLIFVPREAGVKFFRFNAGLAAILLIVALAFLFRSIASLSVPEASGIGAVSVAFAEPAAIGVLALIASTTAVVVYWATVGRILSRIRPALVAVAVVGGLLAIVLQGVLFDNGVELQMLTVASFLSSAVLLGGACTAMILGHWYLVIPSMQVSYLQSIVKLHIASMVVRVVVVAAAVWYALTPSFSAHFGVVPSFRHYIMSIDGIFFWQRVLFGLAGPAVLSYLTWETAKIRSTQSATGILYVDFFTVVVGELLAKFILLATRVPV
jgi:protein NrfD